MKHYYRWLKIILVALTVNFIAGCGQTGPLYLPAPKSNNGK